LFIIPLELEGEEGGRPRDFGGGWERSGSVEWRIFVDPFPPALAPSYLDIDGSESGFLLMFQKCKVSVEEGDVCGRSNKLCGF